MADLSLQPGESPANPQRARSLDKDFGPLLSADDFKQFREERWPGVQRALPIVNYLATYGRGEFLDRARTLSSTIVNDDDDEDGLLVLLQTSDDLLNFFRAQTEILTTIQARLFVIADDLIMESGQPSTFAPDEPFDAEEWIKKATDGGATMFVRGDELWIGMLARVGNSELIEELRAELDDDARTAVRDVLASRGLVCEDA